MEGAERERRHAGRDPFPAWHPTRLRLRPIPVLVDIRGQDTTVDQRMLQFIRQIKRIGESKASGQQPDSQQNQDFLSDEPIH